MEMSETISTPSMGILPGIEERFSFKTLIFPDITEPSNLSGFTVNVCASLLGMKQCDTRLRQILFFLALYSAVLSAVPLNCFFSRSADLQLQSDGRPGRNCNVEYYRSQRPVQHVCHCHIYHLETT